ncbi:MAG TPA: hypothetical protein VIY56_00140 [Vicinamibacterales bacterium]
MRQLFVGSVMTMACLWVAVPPAIAQREFVFFAQFTDTAGKPVTTLTAADIEVSEDGTAGKILKLEPVDWPVRVALMLDNGTGASERLVQVRNGAKGFIEALPAGVEMSLHTLSPQPRMLVRPTADKEALLKGVDLFSPDSGAGRFVEGLIETVARFEKEKGNNFPVIVMLGSLTTEGSQIRDRDVKQMFERLVTRGITVHAVLAGNTNPGGSQNVANATQIAIAATKQTGGQYQSIAAVTRLATLLPEIGAQIAASHARQSQQYRITLERPQGKSGPVGQVGLAARGGMTVNLTLDGRMP